MSVQVWAHRGASAYSPENTIEAFLMACEMGADGIELDVYLSADGHIVVSHDGDLLRCSGKPGKVTALTLAELKEYNVGVNHADRYPGKTFTVPTLCEVYEAVRPYGITVNVELKGSGAEILDKAVKCADDLSMSGNVVYSSFNHFNLTGILDRRPHAHVAPLYGSELVKSAQYAKSFGAYALHPHYGALYNEPDYVENAHSLGVRVHPWTVDGEDDLKRLFALGIDAIITNKPDVALRLLGREKK